MNLNSFASLGVSLRCLFVIYVSPGRIGENHHRLQLSVIQYYITLSLPSIG